VIEADPDGGDDVGRVADEPGVAVVVGGAGLSGDVAETVALEACRGATLHDAAQQGVHDVHRRRVGDAVLLDGVDEERLAAIVTDLPHQVRLDRTPRFGKAV